MAFIKEENEETPNRRDGAARRPPRILVADDDPSVRALFPKMLSADYHCRVVTSAEEAQEVLHQDEDFRLIVSDVRMGGMNGIDLVRYVRAHHAHIPVIIMSGAGETEITVEAFRAGACDYVFKPFDTIDMGEAVVRALERPAPAPISEEQIREMRWNASAAALALALGCKDNETSGHAARVVHYSLRLGREMGLGHEAMIALKLGSRLHDIGKIGVDDRVLRKPTKLDEGEWEQMKQHPRKGMELVIGADLPEAAARVVGQHHEQWDGSGYPRGLRGDEIDTPARIFSVIDAYDAITSDRCYRRAQNYEAALAELRRCAGTQFDPAVVQAFARVPPGDWVRIRSHYGDDEHLASAVA